MSRPYTECSDAFQQALMHGTGDENIAITSTRGGRPVVTERPFEGLIAQLTRLHHDQAESVNPDQP